MRKWHVFGMPLFRFMKELPKILLKSCLDGEDRGHYALYKACYGMMMRICLRYRNNEQEAVAMMNEAFLKVLDNLKKYNDKIPFDAWVKRITINVLIDDFRKHTKMKEIMNSVDFTEMQPNDNGHFNFNLGDQHLEADYLRRLIRKLPNATGKVFILYAIDGFTHKEIANLLDIKEGTSKWHLADARKKLQRMIATYLNSQKVLNHE